MNAIMRFFESFASPLFSEDAEGRQVYFPSGAWGAGYLAKDAEAARKLRAKVRNSFIVFFVVVLPVVIQFIPLSKPGDLPLLIAVSVAIGMMFNIVLRFYARGMQRSEVKLSFGEARTRHLKTLGRGWLIAMIFLSLPLIGLGAAILVLDNPEMAWLGWTLIVMFGACLISVIVNLRAHARVR